MMGLAENAGVQLSEVGLNFRFRALARFSIEQIEAAAFNIAETYKYLKLPPIAEFIERIEGSVDDRAEVEASRVIEAVRRHGHYETVSFDDPVTHAVIVQKYGGWIRLCREHLTTENAVRFFPVEFQKAYKAFKASGLEDHRPLIGAGSSDRHNKVTSIKGLISNSLKRLEGKSNEA